MAKKLLAVVLAVLIAVSAMAVTVFADQRIDLFKNADTKNVTVTATFDIPVYGLYGYVTAGDYMMLTLPTGWGTAPFNWNGANAKEVGWSVVVNGMSFKLPNQGNACADPSAETVTGITYNEDNTVKEDKRVKVTLGYLAHDYDGRDTAIPQSISFNGISSIRLVATFTTPNGTADSWRYDSAKNAFKADGAYATAVKAEWYQADGTPVPGSISYGYTWNANIDTPANDIAGAYDFVTKEWDYQVKEDSAVPLTWDHTLANRAILANAESCELVVELHKPINGQAVYTLYANTGDATYATNYQNLWWQYDASRKYVDSVIVEDSVNELRFNVPMNILVEQKYGTYNREFVIFENITLLNSNVMSDYMHIDRAKACNNDGNASGSIGYLSWVPSWEGDNTIARWKGNKVNYARTGRAGVYEASRQTFTIKATDPEAQYDNPKDTGVKLTENAVYSFTAKKGADGSNPAMWHVFVGDTAVYGGWDWDKAIEITAKTATDKGAKIGDPIKIVTNNWSNGEYTEWSCTVVENTNLGADVTAKAIYLNFKETEAEPATPDTPTEAGDNTEDVEGDNVNVEDNTPAPAEKNPTTGVALAVVPMLVAAVAAVLAKKH